MNKEEKNTKKKILNGTVFSNKKYLEGTLTILVLVSKRFDIYNKSFIIKRKYIVDYPQKNPIEIGAKVKIQSCKKISKTKSHVFCEVL